MNYLHIINTSPAITCLYKLIFYNKLWKCFLKKQQSATGGLKKLQNSFPLLEMPVYGRRVLFPFLEMLVYDRRVLFPLLEMLVDGRRVLFPLLEMLVYDRRVLFPLLEMLVYGRRALFPILATKRLNFERF